jgi:hypothetical protein
MVHTIFYNLLSDLFLWKIFGIITLYPPVLSTVWRFSPQCTKIVRWSSWTCQRVASYTFRPFDRLFGQKIGQVRCMWPFKGFHLPKIPSSLSTFLPAHALKEQKKRKKKNSFNPIVQLTAPTPPSCFNQVVHGSYVVGCRSSPKLLVLHASTARWPTGATIGLDRRWIAIDCPTATSRWRKPCKQNIFTSTLVSITNLSLI